MLLPEDERRLLQALRAFDEEFGPETLIISIPKRLAYIYDSSKFKPIPVKAESGNKFTIKSSKYSAVFTLEV